MNLGHFFLTKPDFTTSLDQKNSEFRVNFPQLNFVSWCVMALNHMRKMVFLLDSVWILFALNGS